MNKPIDIAVSLVLHNEQKFIPRLASALKNQTVKPCCIYVTDNNSRDNSAALLKELLPDAYVHLLQKNPGYGTAHNLNLDKAFRDGADAVLILNTDTSPETTLIQTLQEFLTKNPDTGIVAPLILYGHSNNDTGIVQSFRIKANFRRGTIKNIDDKKYLSSANLPLCETVNYFSGTACVITKRTFETIGGFTEDNFMYGEEMDYSFRAKNKNIKITAVRNAVVRHYHDWSEKNIDGLCREYYYINRNRIRYFKKYGISSGLLLFVANELVMLPLRLRWLARKGGKRFIRAFYLGIIHGLKNVSSKMEHLNLYE
ncbi:MAG: glycosyltransferase family 2 protein [Chlorobi bacterium]|nr:glycosyltransferase family 2 protein [Chlorobiota bacterium]